MDIGVNLPWGDYGNDFGVTDSSWLSVFPSADDVCNLQLKVLRVFILADGRQLDNGIVTTPTEASLSADFIRKFQKLMDAVHAVNVVNVVKTGCAVKLKLIPVFIDYEFAYTGVSMGKDSRGMELFAKGRANLINDETNRKALLEHVLTKLVNASNDTPEHRDTICAWELINEPELCTDGANPAAGGQENVRLPNMREFIQKGADIIRGANFDATVGFQYFNTLSKPEWKVSELGLTIYQFHYYGYLDKGAEKAMIPKAPTLYTVLPGTEAPTTCPCFIGEIRTNWIPGWSKELITELTTSPSSPSSLFDIESKSLKSLLCEAHDHHYPLVLLWSVNAQDDDTNWEKAKHQILDYYEVNPPD